MRQIKYVATGEIIEVEDQVALNAIIGGIATASNEAITTVSHKTVAKTKSATAPESIDKAAPEIAAFIENEIEIK